MNLNIKIGSISLLANDFIRSFNMQDNAKYNINADIEINYDLTDDKEMLGVMFTYKMEIPAEKEDDGPQFTYTSLHFAELYITDYRDNPDYRKSLDRYVNVNVAAIIFPFVREHLATITMKAGMAPIFIPSINFIERYQKINDL